MRRFWLPGTLLAVILIGTLVALFVPRPYVASATIERQYQIEEDFTRVRKILVRTNAVKEVVGMNNAELLDQQWEEVGFDVMQLLRDPDWNVQVRGRLRVRTNDAYVGQQEIELLQNVAIEPNDLKVSTNLASPAGRLRDYQARSHFGLGPQGGTLVQTSLKLVILTRTPLLFRSVARQRVREAAMRSLQGQEAGIRRVVQENRDSLLILP